MTKKCIGKLKQYALVCVHEEEITLCVWRKEACDGEEEEEEEEGKKADFTLRLDRDSSLTILFSCFISHIDLSGLAAFVCRRSRRDSI